MTNRFHVWTQESVTSAADCVTRHHHRVHTTAHLLFGVVDRGKRMSQFMEQECHVSMLTFDAILHDTKFIPDGLGPDYRFSKGYVSVLKLAEELSHSDPISGGGEIHPEHLLAAILIVNDKDTRLFVRRFNLQVDSIVSQLVKPRAQAS